MGPIAQRVRLARAWGVSPSELRNCTLAETGAMMDLLDWEYEMRNRG